MRQDMIKDKEAARIIENRLGSYEYVEIVENPSTRELYGLYEGKFHIFGGGGAGDGSTINRWQIVGFAPSLTAWRENPARYTKAYVIGLMKWGMYDAREVVEMIGKPSEVIDWMADHAELEPTFKPLFLFSTREAAIENARCSPSSVTL
jgi:hypothetical protein